MTVGNIANLHDANSGEHACDSVGSEASTASNQMDSIETAAISQQLDLSSISNYLAQSHLPHNAEIQPEELDIVHQQLAVQALKRRDFKAVAQISAWMAQNQQRKTDLLPPLSKEEYMLSSTIDSSAKSDGASFPATSAASQSAHFVDSARAVQQVNTAPSHKQDRSKESLRKSKHTDAPESKFGSSVELVPSIAEIEPGRTALTRGSVENLNQTRNRKDKTVLGDFRQFSPNVIIDSRPESETPSPPSAGSAEGAASKSETKQQGSLCFFCPAYC
jgi:hypothetical protein